MTIHRGNNISMPHALKTQCGNLCTTKPIIGKATTVGLYAGAIGVMVTVHETIIDFNRPAMLYALAEGGGWSDRREYGTFHSAGPKHPTRKHRRACRRSTHNPSSNQPTDGHPSTTRSRHTANFKIWRGFHPVYVICSPARASGMPVCGRGLRRRPDAAAQRAHAEHIKTLCGMWTKHQSASIDPAVPYREWTKFLCADVLIGVSGRMTGNAPI